MRRRSIYLALLPGAMALLALVASAAIALATNTVFTGGSYGYDISYPDKTGPYPTTAPSGSFTFGIVGVTGGKAFTKNTYLANEYSWVTSQSPSQTVSLYMNLNYPVGRTAQQYIAAPDSCAKTDKACQAHNYGWNAAKDAMDYANSVGATAKTWWLDIETANSWSPKTDLNDQVIQGAVDYLTQVGHVTAGVYSVPSMWRSIAGSWSPTPKAPTWVAESAGQTQMPSYCSSTYDFGGAGVAAVQYWNGSYDLDYACP